MATTTRRKKTTLPAVDDMPQAFETIAISDVCTQNGLSEQTFRLALMEFQPDDFDSVRAIPVTVAEGVLATIQATSKALPQTIETSETVSPQELQPSQETATEQPQKPQNSSIATSSPKAISSPATGATVPTALTEFIAKAQDDIELFDLVHSYRNQQILTNSESRDSELVVKLREQRLSSRALVFDQLRNLNSRQPIAQELPELPASLSDEIAALSDELGKKLIA
jgi:hypothetical protein